MLKSCCSQSISGHQLGGLVTQSCTFSTCQKPQEQLFQRFQTLTSSWNEAETWWLCVRGLWLRCVFKKTLKSKEQVKLSTWLSPWIPADRNSRLNPRFPVSKWESCDKSGSPTAGRWSTIHSHCQNHSMEEGRQKFSIQLLPGYGFRSGFASRASQPPEKWEAAVVCRERSVF